MIHIKRKWIGVAESVLTEVSDETEISKGRLQSKDSDAIVSSARRIAFTALRLMGLSYPEVARVCGGYNHSTVLMAVKKARPEEMEVAQVIATKLGVVASGEQGRREALHKQNLAKWVELCGDDISYHRGHAEAVAQGLTNNDGEAVTI